MARCEDLLSPFYAAIDSELSSNSLNFPTSFDLIARATKVIDSPVSTVKDFALLVQSEPVLMAKVLRMANSVAMNPYGREIPGAFEAVQRLGSKKIKCMVYLVVMEQVRQDTRSEELKKSANIIWKHSLDVACMSFMIAKHSGVCDADEALLAGIMIDIGQFFLISKLGCFPEIVEDPKCVTELIVKNHVRVAKQIIDTMKLPSVIIDVYNANLKHHPVWPLADIEDVLMLSDICTNFRNPFLQNVDDVKKRSFLGELSPSESSDLDLLLEDIDELKVDLFNSMTH